uniref:Uncharacterized protein n=1 Tax=Candidatus Kentrum sp. FW TaxID=2126338 RepID=A0A450TD15_9GAMM|nr:MAG: hypothetical protein BECKFW1821C_GA0114237_100647 [Candidatus Kentron sp. FW]
MIYNEKPGMVIAKQRLSLVGAGICLVLGVAASVSHGVWFTHVISSSERIPVIPCPSIGSEALHPVKAPPDIHGGERETFIVAPGGDNSVSRPFQPLPTAPFRGEEPATVDVVPYISGTGKTKTREEPARESKPIPFLQLEQILITE